MKNFMGPRQKVDQNKETTKGRSAVGKCGISRARFSLKPNLQFRPDSSLNGGKPGAASICLAWEFGDLELIHGYEKERPVYSPPFT